MDVYGLLNETCRKIAVLEHDNHILITLLHKTAIDAEKKKRRFAYMLQQKDEIIRWSAQADRINAQGTPLVNLNENLFTKMIRIHPSASLTQLEPSHNACQGSETNLTEAAKLAPNDSMTDRELKVFEIIHNCLRLASAEMTSQAESISESRRLRPSFAIESRILDAGFQHESFKCLLSSVPHVNFQLVSFTLLYRATEHGFKASTFHERCDNKGRTLALFKSADTNDIYGAYTSVCWDSSGTSKQDKEAFLFSLVNKENKPLIFYSDPWSPHSIFCHEAFGPIFCERHDLLINDCANASDANYVNVGSTLQNSDLNTVGGIRSLENNLARKLCFIASEIEVYQIS